MSNPAIFMKKDEKKIRKLKKGVIHWEPTDE